MSPYSCFEFCEVSNKVATNGQGLLQGWNSLLVRPEPLLIKDIKVQVNKQKLNNVRPAQMKHNSDKMTIAPTSSQPCSKPNVGGSLSQRTIKVWENSNSSSFEFGLSSKILLITLNSALRPPILNTVSLSGLLAKYSVVTFHII